jgi:CheY-like chemotaxis protein
MQRGARSFHLKPLSTEALNSLFTDIIEYNDRKVKNLLLVEDNELDSSQIAKILDNGELVNIEITNSGLKALELIKENNYDGIIVDFMLPDIEGLKFVTEISAIKKVQMTPVIIYSAKDFAPRERMKLKQYANRILLKDVNSLELLLEETVMLLHLNNKKLLPEKRKLIENLRSKKDVLSNKTILVVDDDVRKSFRADNSV